MKLNIKQLSSDKFIRGTFVLTVVTFLSSVLNYFVHPILTRSLTIAEYGDYQALLSFITILGIAAAVIMTALTKEFSVLSASAPEEIKFLRRRATYYLSFVGLFLFLLVFIFSGLLNKLFKISHPATLIVAALSLIYVFPLIINKALLTGRQYFSALSLNNFLDALSRLALVILLVIFLKLNLMGAAIALGLAGLISLLVSFWQIKQTNLPLESKAFSGSLKSLSKYALLVLWFTAISQFFYNYDMLFVKSFFSPEEAGLYGALLTIGRIIFFVGGAVPLVMFSVISGLKDDTTLRRHKIFVKSLALMTVLTLPTTAVIAFWPELVIKILVGSKYLSIAPYLPLFALAMLLLTLLTVLSQYFLALAKRRSLVVLSIAAVLEIIFLLLFNNSLWHIIYSLIAVFGGASLALLIIFAYDYQLTKKNIYEGKHQLENL